ncbi:hypothetical protein [Polaribacter glomeratus]|uniref:Uncharacterized protein n=1 Tax=Polaribacter glomeratus TaxID=102 RepID=A0A2S7WWB2_9FLAO|nr:hypothetical protein [Polaribacter glomeratus]PQJ81858.1 hypothetical protein BTO16_04405 [Polaribacter glomeratus]TXD66218.1 hypothetical protein ESX12_05365 [Polaribacter glomeratus]
MEKKTLIKGASNSQSPKKNTIKFRGVTKKQIDLLKEKKLPLAVALGLIAGIGSQYAFLSATGKIVENEEVEIDETEAETEETFDFEVPTNIEFSDAVTEDMSFGEAFKTARADTDGSGFFNWHGNTYHTLNKEEWDALSDEEKQEFYDKIKEHSDFDNSDYNKIDKDETDADIDEDDNDDDNDDVTDEISYEDIVFEDENDYKDTNASLDEFVTVDEIGDTVDIIEGLNDGEATEEAEGIDGGAAYLENDFEDTADSDSDLEYDDDFADDLI